MTGDLIAHRLGSAYGPDNSETALRRSLSGPLEGLETDVCLTADGELVLLHNPLLSLGTTLSGWAHERTLEELLQGSLLGPDCAARRRAAAHPGAAPALHAPRSDRPGRGEDSVGS